MKKTDYEKYMDLISKDRLDEATDFRRETMAKVIYKFYPLYSEDGSDEKDVRTFNTLKNNQIWGSRMEYFNDPFEGKGLYFDKDKDVETRVARCLRIASFAENAATNISMWAYYANSSKGFCVKYRVLDKSNLYDVNYISERQSQSQLWEDARIKTSQNKSTENELLLIFEKYLTKHISWSNEKEYRIIKDVEDAETDEKGRLFDCEEVGLKVEKIFTGIECTEKNKKTLNCISLSLGCGEIVESAMSETKFLLFDE